VHCTYLLLDGRGGGAVRLGTPLHAATVPRSFDEVGGLMSYGFAESEALAGVMETPMNVRHSRKRLI
jgi:hypothetical protein